MRTKRFLLIIIFAMLWLGSSSSLASEDSLPRFSGYVNDYAGVLSQEAKLYIDQIIAQVEKKTTAQIAVVTIKTVKPLAIEQYTVRLFEKWGIGQKGKDNGLLILLAVDDKKVRIETGYGLEGVLPDAICSNIIYSLMVPAFKGGSYSSGILAGVMAVSEAIAKEYGVSLTVSPNQVDYVHRTKRVSKKASLVKTFAYLIFFILFFGLRSGLLFFWILGPTGRRRGGYWYGSGFGGRSGGSFGGGFGGFGGGFSGGGGASGGW